MEIYAHAGIGTSITIDCHLCGEPRLFEISFPFIVIEELKHGIIGDRQVYFPVTVEVGDGNTKSLTRLAQAYLLAYFGKGAIPIIVVDQRADDGEDIRVAVGPITFAMFAAPDIFPVPHNVAQHDQVELAVVVQINPCGRGRPGLTGNR